MALVTSRECSSCHEEFMAINDQAECGVCKGKVEDAKRKAHFDALDVMSIDERIRKLEKWQYNYTLYQDPLKTKY